MFHLHQTLTFAQLAHGVCDKFDSLDSRLVYFFFTILGYNKFKIDCDDDIQNMLSLAKSFVLDHIDALVQMWSYGSGIECGRSGSHNVERMTISMGRCEILKTGPICYRRVA